jgi:NADP-dependent 3-hydroxy acid dehydrogenase YdfG
MENINMSNNISGKVIIITGASSGIGLATAKLLASHGAILSLAARRKDKLDKLVKEIQEAGGKAQAFTTDVSKLTDVEDLITNTIAAFGKIDVLFNNAGIMPLSMLEGLRYDEWDKMIDTNIKGVLYGIGAALPHFKAQKSGHFINVSSVAGHLVAPSSAVYSGTKFAVRAISEGLRQEVKPYNIRTSIISPGIVESELTNSITDENIKPMVSQIASMAISADSIARAVAYVIDQPQDVDVNEMIIRPTAQPM